MSSFHTTHQGCVIPSTKGYSFMYCIFINVIDSLKFISSIHPTIVDLAHLQLYTFGRIEMKLNNLPKLFQGDGF